MSGLSRHALAFVWPLLLVVESCGAASQEGRVGYPCVGGVSCDDGLVCKHGECLECEGEGTPCRKDGTRGVCIVVGDFFGYYACAPTCSTSQDNCANGSCYVYSGSSEAAGPYCMPIGTKSAGENCSDPNDCERDVQCVNGVCRESCNTALDCRDHSSQCSNVKGGISVCMCLAKGEYCGSGSPCCSGTTCDADSFECL
jgi:hypothetical protein